MPSRSAIVPQIFVAGAYDAALRCLRIERTTGGGCYDTMTYQVDLAAKGARLINVILGSQQGAVVAAYALINSQNKLLHWGKSTVTDITLGEETETLIVTSRVEPWHFGVQLTGTYYYEPLSGQLLVVAEDTVFNPEIDGVILPNESGQPWLPGGANGSSVFLDPESVRTAPAQAVQKGNANAPKLWTLRDAIQYLCLALNPNQTNVLNPASYDALPTFYLQNSVLPRGQFLSDYLDMLLPGFGLGWRLDLSNGVQPRIAFFVRGAGNPVSLYLGVPGSYYAGDQVAENKTIYNLGNVRNVITVQGDWRYVEGTFVLQKAWDPSLDKLPIDQLAKGSPTYELGSLTPAIDSPSYRDVWRKWTLNEAGDTIGLRSEIKAPYDLTKFFGHPVCPRRRRFWPTLTFDRDLAPIGETQGITVEYSLDNGRHWQGLMDLEDRTCQLLKRECGIRFDGFTPPKEFLDYINSGGVTPHNVSDVQVRVTATLRDDLRLGTTIGPDPGSPLADPAPMFVDESQRWRLRVIDKSSVNYANVSQGKLPADVADDTQALTTYAQWLQFTHDLADVGGTLSIEGFDNCNFDLGDVVIAIVGRNISLNAKGLASGQAVFPQIVGLTFDVLRQRGEVQLETYRDPGQLQQPAPGQVAYVRARLEAMERPE